MSDSGKGSAVQEVTDRQTGDVSANDTICSEEPALADLARQLAALSPEDRQALAEMLGRE